MRTTIYVLFAGFFFAAGAALLYMGVTAGIVKRKIRYKNPDKYKIGVEAVIHGIVYTVFGAMSLVIVWYLVDAALQSSNQHSPCIGAVARACRK